MDIKYQCQTAIKKITENIKPIPRHFEVSAKYVNELDNETFVKGFLELREILTNIYYDMVVVPEEYGLILVGMEVSEYKNSKPRDSRASALRLMALLYNFGRAGELAGNKLHITPEAFQEILKIKYVGFSWSQNAPMILKKLSGFGFDFIGLKGNSLDKNAKEYILSYPDNPVLMNVLKGYAMSVPVIPHFPKELINLEYYTLEDVEPDEPISAAFAIPLKDKEKQLLNQLLNSVQKDYINVCKELIEYAVSLGYLPHKTQASGFAVSFTGKKTNRTVIKISPVTGLNHKKFIPELRIKFSASKNYSDIFANAVKNEAENHGGIYTGCFSCGKCPDAESKMYKYVYPDGKIVRLCAEVMLAPDWNKENLPEIKEVIKTQDDFWLKEFSNKTT